MENNNSQLVRLAGLYGINDRYTDMLKRTRNASDDSLLAALKSIGAPVSEASDVDEAIRVRQLEEWQQVLQPVIITWQNEPLNIDLKIPAALIGSTIRYTLRFESGEIYRSMLSIESNLVTTTVELESNKYAAIKIPLNRNLPFGYHSIEIAIREQTYEALIISAPHKAFGSPGSTPKIWGLFLPLYSLHSKESWGAGDFSDLESFIEWTAGQGGKITGTLPLLPSFINDEFGPGPYMPVSRLFWNEFYLDISAIPELEYSDRTRELLNSRNFLSAVDNLKSQKRINYSDQLALKRQALMLLTEHFFETNSERLSQFYEYMLNHPELDKYARFRAAGEMQGLDWHKWPGAISAEDYSNKIKQYYMYTGWLAEQQLQQLSQTAQENGVSLYMDLPVGVHPLSYDVWNYPGDFVAKVNTGAPPDPVFTSGQNWHFPPFHPFGLRQSKYQQFIKIIQHQLKFADILRIDHIMGFNRLYWIPDGIDTHQGVYVNYPADEYYAILSLESFRNEAVIVGEDLGLVPQEVRRMMNEHNIFRMFIGQYQLISENKLGTIPSESVAGLNTHDMFPFLSFWETNDIVERQKLGLIDSKTAEEEIVQRKYLKMALVTILQKRIRGFEDTQNPKDIYKALLELMAASPAWGLLINMEDLWGETGPQNIPGTQNGSNWTQKAKYSLEEFSQINEVTDILKNAAEIRRRGH